MLKKVIPVVISLCLICSIGGMAAPTSAGNSETIPEVAEQIPQGDRGNMGTLPSGGMQNRGTPPQMPNGEMPPAGISRGQRPAGEVTPPQNAEEVTPPQGDFAVPQNNDANAAAEATPSPIDGNAEAENSQMPSGDSPFGGRMPEGFPGAMQNSSAQSTETQPTGFLGFVKTYSTPITSVVLLGLAFIFVVFYRRKNY